MFGLVDNFYENLELHVHIPEGAVPKDGPSAGITLVTAILSSLTKIPIRTDIAMTGEITLIGDVLAVGGLNEKLLAAKRNGLTEIIIPDKNRKDIDELPEELLEGLTIHYVKKIKDVLVLAFVKSPYVAKKINRRLGIENGVQYLTAYEDGAPLTEVNQPEQAKTGDVWTDPDTGTRYRKLSDGSYEEM